MKISVILPTNRPAGPIHMFYALAKQTFPKDSFELIVIDDYPVSRKYMLETTAEKLGILNIRVFSGKPNYWRSNRLIANARNTGLIYAEGDLIVFTDDYCWAPPQWLEEHWKTYVRTQFTTTMLGGMKAVKYVNGRFDDLDKLPQPVVGNEIEGAFIRNLAKFRVSDTRGAHSKTNCGGQWFYTANASAPLKKLVEVNGFDEEYDLTSEEDVDLGTRLERAGCKFWYRPDPTCTIFHMDHREIDRRMRTSPKRYKSVTPEELRSRKTVESNPDEIQLVLKEKYNVHYDGSWGLLERNKGRLPIANFVDGKLIFNLKEERKKVGI